MLSDYCMVSWLIAISASKKTDDHQELLAFSLAVALMVVLSPISWIHYLLFLVFPVSCFIDSLSSAIIRCPVAGS